LYYYPGDRGQYCIAIVAKLHGTFVFFFVKLPSVLKGHCGQPLKSVPCPQFLHFIRYDGTACVMEQLSVHKTSYSKKKYLHSEK